MVLRGIPVALLIFETCTKAMSGACEYKTYFKKQEVFIEEENENKHVEIISVAAMAAVLIFVAWILGRQYC
jgi:hypothetical protein